MPDCYLTEAQQSILREIAIALQEGMAKHRWKLAKDAKGLRVLSGLPSDIAAKISADDLEDFAACGYLEPLSNTNWKINLARFQSHNH